MTRFENEITRRIAEYELCHMIKLPSRLMSGINQHFS